MGILFIQHLYTDGNVVQNYTCRCGTHIASGSHLIWEGCMGTNIPAILFSTAINLDLVGPQRTETLSSGTYQLQNIHCKVCKAALGWKYLHADNIDQKYKEGTVLVATTALNTLRNTSQDDDDTDDDLPELHEIDDE